MKTAAVTVALTFALSTLNILAQDAGNPPPPPPGGDAPGHGSHRQPPPLIAALDANRDGVIDEAEINNAPAALKTLDKNGDGKLTREELRPPRPGGPGGSEGSVGEHQGKKHRMGGDQKPPAPPSQQ